MPGFSDIIGQEHIKEHLKHSILSNKISHAYLLCGEALSGKEFIARVFAQAVMCDDPKENAEPCMKCHSCLQAMTDNHPDIIYVTHEKPNIISVDEIRTQIVSDISIKPYNGKRKIYIIKDAEKMNVYAQNAILKTLEEPPEYAVILLLTTNLQLILPTIISRCIPLNMRPVEDALIRKYLMSEIKIPDYKADICTAFARGNIGKARSLAQSEEFDEVKNETIRILKYIDRMDSDDILDAVSKLTEYKQKADDFLQIMTAWYRDVLIYKSTSDEDEIIFKEEVKTIAERADKSTYEGLENILKTIGSTKSRLASNVNFEVTMELLLLAIKEN